MTDISQTQPTATHDWTSAAAHRRVRRRYAADRRLQLYGIAAIGTAMTLLGILFTTLIYAGYAAFTTTKIELGVFLDPEKIDKDNIRSANFRKIVRDAFQSYFPDVQGRTDKRNLSKILSSGAAYIVRDYAVRNPDKIGELVTISVPVSDPFDQLYKGIIPREIQALSSDRILLYRQLEHRDVLSVQGGVGVVKTTLFVDPAQVPEEGGVEAADYQRMINEAFRSFFLSEPSLSYREILSPNAAEALKKKVVANPELVGKTIEVDLPLSANYDNLLQKGEAKIRNPRFRSDKEFAWFELSYPAWTDQYAIHLGAVLQRR